MNIDYNNQTYQIDRLSSWKDDGINAITLNDNTNIFGSIFSNPIRENLTGCKFIKCTFNNVNIPPMNEVID